VPGVPVNIAPLPGDIDLSPTPPPGWSGLKYSYLSPPLSRERVIYGVRPKNKGLKSFRIQINDDPSFNLKIWMR